MIATKIQKNWNFKSEKQKDREFSLFHLSGLLQNSFLKIKFCNPDIGTNCWQEVSTSISPRGNTFFKNHVNNEICNKLINHAYVESAERRKINGGGAPIIKNRRRRPPIDGGSAAWPAQGSTRSALHPATIRKLYLLVCLYNFLYAY